MQEFEAGSKHKFSFSISVPVGWFEGEYPVTLRLEPAEITATIGPIMTKEEWDAEVQKRKLDVPYKIVPLLRLSYHPRNFSFSITMPNKPGYYILTSDLPIDKGLLRIDSSDGTARLLHEDENRNIHVIEKGTK